MKATSLKFRKKLYKKLTGKNKCKISNRERNNILQVRPNGQSVYFGYIRRNKMFINQIYKPIAIPKYITVDISLKKIE